MSCRKSASRHLFSTRELNFPRYYGSSRRNVSVLVHITHEIILPCHLYIVSILYYYFKLFLRLNIQYLRDISACNLVSESAPRAPIPFIIICTVGRYVPDRTARPTLLYGSSSALWDMRKGSRKREGRRPDRPGYVPYIYRMSLGGKLDRKEVKFGWCGLRCVATTHLVAYCLALVWQIRWAGNRQREEPISIASFRQYPVLASSYTVPYII